VWGAFLTGGIDELLHCEKSFNSSTYRRILQNVLLPTIEKFFCLKRIDQILIFNKIVLLPKMQRQPRSGLRTSPSGSCFGLGQSSDLIPIVNIWSHIKLKRTGRHFSTTHELFEAINIEWNNIDSSSCEKLSASWGKLLYKQYLCNSC